MATWLSASNHFEWGAVEARCLSKTRIVEPMNSQAIVEPVSVNDKRVSGQLQDAKTGIGRIRTGDQVRFIQREHFGPHRFQTIEAQVAAASYSGCPTQEPFCRMSFSVRHDFLAEKDFRPTHRRTPI